MVTVRANVLHVRATSEGRFDLEPSTPWGDIPTLQRGLSLAEAVEAIRTLPSSQRIHFFSEGRRSGNLIALANAALQRSSGGAARAPGSPVWAAEETRAAVPTLG